MKRVRKPAWTSRIAAFLLIGLATPLVAQAPCPPLTEAELAKKGQRELESMVKEYLEELKKLHQECSNPAGDLVDQLNAREGALKEQVGILPRGAKRGLIEEFL
jgi:hypothetical protein